MVVPSSPAQPSIHVDVASAMGSGASGNPTAPGPAALQKAPNTGLPGKLACRFNDVDDVIRVRENHDPAQTPKLKIKVVSICRPSPVPECGGRGKSFKRA